MRKLLLSIFMMVAVVATAFGQDLVSQTITLLTNSGASTWTGSASGYSTTFDGFSIQYLKANSTTNCRTPDSDHIRIYQNAQFIVTNVAGCTITKIVINTPGSSYTLSIVPNTGVVTLNTTANQIIWSCDTDNNVSSVTFDNKDTSGQIRVKSIEVTYLDTPPAVALPVITPDGGNVIEDQTVSISCATEGASIYYTTDGSTPTASSTLYTEPFTVTQSCIVKAIAKKGDDVSEIEEVQFTFPTAVASIADFVAFTSDDAGTFIKFTCPLTVTYRGATSATNSNNVHLFVQDGDDALQIFSTVDADFGSAYVNGDIIPAGVVGTVGIYNSALQLTSPITSSFGTVTKGAPIAPAALTVAEAKAATSAMQSEYVKLSGVTLSGNNLVSGSDQVAIYNRFAGVTVPTDSKTYDVVGIVNMNNTTPQIYPISFTEVVSDVPAPVFSVAGGNYTATQTVTITCDDADAVIFYTIDGTTPNGSSLEYKEPIVIDVTTTLKAIAYQGTSESTVTSATYTFPETITIASIKDFNDNVTANTGKLIKFSCPLTVSYRGGSTSTSATGKDDVYVYVQDGDDALLIYSKGDASFASGYKNGDVIPAGVVGTVSVNYGVNQLTTPVADSFGATTTGTPVVPTVCDISDFITNYQTYISRLVEVQGVTISGSNFVSGESTLPYYNRFTGVTVPSDAVKYDVIGIGNVYSSKAQLYPISFTVSTGIQDTDASAATIIGGYSQIEINATENAEVLIVNTLGQAVASKTISAGATTVGVAPGLYIVKVNNTVSKVVVK